MKPLQFRDTHTLSAPTIFPDYNQKKHQAPDTLTTSLALERLRFKHLKLLQNVSPEEQLFRALGFMTGLSMGDIDELPADDAAVLIGQVHASLNAFNNVIAQSIPQPSNIKMSS